MPIPAARHRLLHRIGRRYHTTTETITLGPFTFPFTRITDPDRVLEEVAAEEDRLERLRGKRIDGDYLHLPYWAELWDSAFGLAASLVATPPMRTAARAALDLGCGMGLAGTIAAALGHRVLLADLETPALLFARLNSLPWAHRVRTRRLNWQTDRLAERFDLILGADILYERNQWEHLERFWRRHRSTQGKVLLGEPGRPTGDDFPAWITRRGWHLSESHQSTPKRSIRIFTLSRDGDDVSPDPAPPGAGA